jgi:Uma2 family endonuclease
MPVTTHEIASLAQAASAVPTDFVWRLSVDRYHAMIRAGILTEDDPVELLEGWLITKMSKNPPHSLVTYFVRQVLERLAPAGWYVDEQEPITTDDSEPEPDVIVVQGQRRDYLDRHPGPSDVTMVVEVADATLYRDQVLKKRLYARAGIPVYWIANLTENRFEVYTDPTGPAEEPDYRQRRDYAPSDTLPVVIAGVQVGSIPVQELLP